MYQKHDSFRPRPPSANKFDLGYSRLFDNHYNPRVHLRPWLAHVHTPLQHYNADDSGLGLVETKMKKLSFLKSKHEKIKEVRQKYNSFRNFEEYETVLTNEILVTIEYCTNCIEHSGTTRHSEEKYSVFAGELKRKIIAQYPVIKVLMKPLLFDHHSQAPDAIYLRSRLGALEVQLVTKDSKGTMLKEVIFSKLTTRVFPNVTYVVESLASFLPKDDIMVRLIDPMFDAGSFYLNQQSNQAQKPPNRLKGVHVILRPYKPQGNNSFLDECNFEIALITLVNDSKRMNESFQYNSLNNGTQRVPESKIRPRSAFSSASGKTSNLSFDKGYGNSSKDTTTLSPPKKKPVVEFSALADDYGVVLFKKVPHNIYEIEVIENKNFMPEKRIINVFELIEQLLPLKEEIELRTQEMCFCKVKLHEKKTPVSEATIVIGKKIPDDESKNAILKEKTPGSGLFEFLIDPGEYILNITRYGFMEKIHEFNAIQGENNLEIELKRGLIPTSDSIDAKPAPEAKKSDPFVPRPPSGKQRYSNASNHNPLSQDQSRPNSRAEMEQEVEKKPHQPVYHEFPVDSHEVVKRHHHEKGRPGSSSNKKVILKVLNLDTEEPIFGAQIEIDEIGLKGTTDHEGMIQIPINKLTSGRIEIQHSHFFGVIEDYGEDGGIDLKNLQDKVFYLIPRTSNENEIHVRFVPAGNKKCLRLTILAEESDDGRVFSGANGKQVLILRKLHKKKGVIRILGHIEDMQEFLSSQESLLLVSIRDDCEPVPLNLPYNLQHIRAGVTWDIGFFASKFSEGS